MFSVKRRRFIEKLALFGTVSLAGCSNSGSENTDTSDNSTVDTDSESKNSEHTSSNKQEEASTTPTDTRQKEDAGVDLRVSNYTGDDIQGTVSISNLLDSSESELIFEDTFNISNGEYTTFREVFVVDESESKDYNFSINFDDNRKENFNISFSRTPDSPLVDVDISEESIEYNKILS